MIRDGKLVIFEDFSRDWELPKFRRDEGSGSVHSMKQGSGFSMTFQDSDGPNESDSGTTIGAANAMATFTINTVNGAVVSKSVQTVRPGRFAWLSKLFRRRPAVRPEPVPEITVEEFFRSMKNSAEELAVVDERMAGYASAIRKAKQGGQRALIEKLTRNVAAVRSETQLLAMGLPKFLSEATVVDFVKKAPKGLRLDYVRNFTRVIPDDLLAKKVAADERFIFDNYAVLHYDPNAKSWAETEAEKARRKDPILFGLIEGRRRLYYVGDWVDEFCDLTLDQIADKLGAQAVEQIPAKFEEQTG